MHRIRPRQRFVATYTQDQRLLIDIPHLPISTDTRFTGTPSTMRMHRIVPLGTRAFSNTRYQVIFHIGRLRRSLPQRRQHISTIKHLVQAFQRYTVAYVPYQQMMTSYQRILNGLRSIILRTSYTILRVIRCLGPFVTLSGHEYTVFKLPCTLLLCYSRLSTLFSQRCKRDT